MWTIADITIRKLRETAFLLMLGLAVLTGYLVSGMESIASQLSSDVLLSHLITADTEFQPLLSGTFFAFAISLLLACISGAAEIPREIASGQIQLYLSKSLSKDRYMLGKYIGVLGICMIFFIVIQTSSVLFHFLSENELRSWALILRQFQICLAFIPFVALIIAVSCFAGDVAAIILTVIYIAFSMMFNMIPILLALLPQGFAGQVEGYIFTLYYMFPNFLFYFLNYRMLGFISATMICYSLSIAAIFLMIASYRLHHMDLIGDR